MTVERPDGTRIVEHADGTRITTFYKQDKQELRAPDNETGEEAEYFDVTKMFVKVECTGFATLIFDSDLGSCDTIWGNGTRLHTQANGVSVVHRPDDTQLQIEAKGKRHRAMELIFSEKTNKQQQNKTVICLGCLGVSRARLFESQLTLIPD